MVYDPRSAFHILLDKDMLETILRETTLECTLVKNSKWKPLLQDELEAYICLCILRAVYESRNQNACELWYPQLAPIIFSQVMPVYRFEDINIF